MLGPLGGIRGCRVYWGLAGSVGTRDQKGYRWHKGALGPLGGVRGCRSALEAGRECRYSRPEGV